MFGVFQKGSQCKTIANGFVPKAGDTVECIPYNGPDIERDHKSRGAGWELGKRFVVSSITTTSKSDGNPERYVFWDGNGKGVYGRALKIVG